MSEKDNHNNNQNPEGAQQLAHGLSKPSIESIETPGALLRHYRLERHVSLPELAAVLKVSPDKLDALESDRYEALPDMVFTRALAISICRLLGADSAAVIAKFPSVNSPSLTRDSQGLNKAFKAGQPPSFGSSSGMREGSFAPKVVFLVVCLLVAAVLVYFWPQIQNLISPQDERNAQTQAVSELSGAGGSTGASAGLQSLQVPGLIALQGQAVGSGAVADVTEIFPAPLRQEPNGEEGELAVNNPLSAEGAEALATTADGANQPEAIVDTLRITAQEPVWVQVRDGSNAIVHQSTLPKGRDLSITNNPPLRVEIGRADAVQVMVKGNVFDLEPYSRRNVARFEVMP